MARVQRLTWTDVALHPDTNGAGLKLTLGLGSGLTRRAGDAQGVVHAVTDRGPNLFINQALQAYGPDLASLADYPETKIMPFPDQGPEMAELHLSGDTVRLVQRTRLRTASGQRLGGASPEGGEAELLFDTRGMPLDPDPLGADTEAIAAMPDGSFWLAEEYGPSLLKADADGVVTERWTPAGSGELFEHSGVTVRPCLPERAALRRVNRGFEALCSSADGRWLYVSVQSALKDGDKTAVPIWKLDAATGALAGEWLYPFDPPETFRRDAARRKVKAKDLKICEFAWAGEDRLVVLERIAHSSKLYEIDLARLPKKRLLVSSDDHPEVGPDIEGMTLLSPSEILICSDNDFGVEGAETQFWRITLDAPV